MKPLKALLFRLLLLLGLLMPPVLALTSATTSKAATPSLRKVVYDIRDGDTVYIVEETFVVLPDGTEVPVDVKVLYIFNYSGYLA